MRLSISVDGFESFLVLKNRWTRRDLRDWDQATDRDSVLTDEERDGAKPMPSVEERVARAEARAFALLDSWCTEAYLVVSPERVVKRPADLTPDDALDMDASLYRFLMGAALRAYTERSRLGEPTVERSSDH